MKQGRFLIFYILLYNFWKNFLKKNFSFRSLEILDNSILTELTDYYRSWLPCMSRRNISTYSDEPDDDLVDKIYNSEPVSLEKIEEESLEFQPILKASIEKSEEKKSNESERIRNFQVRTVTSNEEINLLSKSFSESSDCKNTTDEEAWIMVRFLFLFLFLFSDIWKEMAVILISQIFTR